MKKWKNSKNGRVDHFQPRFSTPSDSERKNFDTLSDRGELEVYFKRKKRSKKVNVSWWKMQKTEKVTFWPPKKNFLERFSNFFLMIFRFLGMLFNLGASKSKSPNVIKISKNPLPTLAIIQNLRVTKKQVCAFFSLNVT